MSTYLNFPHKGYIEQMFHVFGYLKVNPERKLCFDIQHPEINGRLFDAHDWHAFYWDAKEAIP